MPTTAFQPFGDEILGLADEVAGGVVDQDVDAAEVAERPLDHLVHLFRLADVDLHRQRIEPAWRSAAVPASRFFEFRLPIDDPRAERAEPLRDREADARSRRR